MDNKISVFFYCTMLVQDGDILRMLPQQIDKELALFFLLL